MRTCVRANRYEYKSAVIDRGRQARETCWVFPAGDLIRGYFTLGMIR